MPKTSIDYSKTIIYKICCKEPSITDIYVGHTTDLVKRRYSHKYRCINPDDTKHHYYIYEFIRINGGWDNWELIKIEDFPCNNHEEALQKERYWLETLQATLNKNKPLRDMREWRKDNKEHEIQYRAKYYETNKKELQKKARSRKHKYYYENRENISRKEICLCGVDICVNGWNRHLQTKKHQNFINSQNS